MYTDEKQSRIKAYRERKNIMKREVIENLLKGLGVAEDKVKEAVDTIMTENGNDIERYKTSETNLKSLLKTANETLEKFKDVDIDGLKGEVQKYKDAAAEAESNSKAEIERLQFGYALDRALRTAGAKNSKAVRALLDEAGLKLNGDSIVGLDEQLKTIRENNDYLFNNDTKPVIVRSTPGATGGTESDDKNK